jgi:hypothetical protein
MYLYTSFPKTTGPIFVDSGLTLSKQRGSTTPALLLLSIQMSDSSSKLDDPNERSIITKPLVRGLAICQLISNQKRGGEECLLPCLKCV